MEQLVARRAHNPKVVGSSPAPATKAKSLKSKDLRLFAFGDGDIPITAGAFYINRCGFVINSIILL